MDLNTEIGNFERASVGSVVKTTLIDLLNKIGGTDPVKNTLGLGGKNHSDYELKEDFTTALQIKTTPLNADAEPTEGHKDGYYVTSGGLYSIIGDVSKWHKEDET